jgi:hypothetical protein
MGVSKQYHDVYVKVPLCVELIFAFGCQALCRSAPGSRACERPGGSASYLGTSKTIRVVGMICDYYVCRFVLVVTRLYGSGIGWRDS